MAKKKGLVYGIIITGMIAGLLLYFEPQNLSDLTNEMESMMITHQEIGIRNDAENNATPYIDSTDYNEITENEKSQIVDLFKKYSYRRTFGTIFSNGSITDLSNEIVNIYVYDENDQLINTIFIADSDNIAVNNKTYVLKKSSAFIDELLNIIDKK